MPTSVLLTKVFRQSDLTFVRMLDELRCAVVSNETSRRLRAAAGHDLTKVRTHSYYHYYYYYYYYHTPN